MTDGEKSVQLNTDVYEFESQIDRYCTQMTLFNIHGNVQTINKTLHVKMMGWSYYQMLCQQTNPFNVILCVHTDASLTVVSSSCSTWSYPLRATQKMMAVTSSKQWIHFLRSERCPPTSNNLVNKASCRKMSSNGHLAYLGH